MRFEDEDEVDRIERGLRRGQWLTRSRVLTAAVALVAGGALLVFFVGDGARVLFAHREATQLSRACGAAPESLRGVADVRAECRTAMRLRLQATPAPVFEDVRSPVSLDGCATTYRAAATQGAIRHEFVCTYDPRTGDSRIDVF